ncbi:PucR family transcriptional regulator [Candidatus Galacturonibacter soehngenii]|uniref:PucR C-terminal helix-turn-helix domain-containing protein n=1 Tax=Candidatus Galacturonatibacter soehngenii TaxID=2307010 RepID=A0A7V7QKQ6_9FIRM|nr:helix-turn-helix domain-containing protein [Candidatus Galacturonibacter soehngenii]KAB1438430.1 hypothetical protein F7O84_12875 [Candidatus Galacturonibacter soehngenii]
MAYLEHIIQRLETTFHIQVHGNSTRHLRIENVQFLVAEDENSIHFQPETLYIGNYQEFHSTKQNGCILLLNSCMDSQAENGLYIYQDLNPFAVCNCIQEELFQSHKANLKKDEMLHVLQAGYGLQSLLDTARTFLNNPITLCTTSFFVLASSPKQFQDDKFDVYNNKFYLENNFIQNMKEQKILDHIFASSAPIYATFEDSKNMEYLFCSIHIKHAAVGYLCLSCAIRPFRKEDSTFLTELSKMISIEMQKDDFYTEKSGLKYEYFLTDLMEQNITNLDFATKRLAQLGHTLYQYFWVIGFSFDSLSASYMNPNYYIDQLLGIFRNSMVFFYKGNLILLLSSKYRNPYEKVNTQKLSHFLQLNQMNIALSFRYENLLDTHVYYKQVCFLLKKDCCNTISLFRNYEDNYMFHLFEGVQNTMNLKSIVHPDIYFLQKYDQENHTEYITTLQAYFLNSRNALSASNYLHIHKSTFFYRIGKIKDLTGFDLENETILFAYEFSFYLLSYLKNTNE